MYLVKPRWCVGIDKLRNLVRSSNPTIVLTFHYARSTKITAKQAAT